MDNLLSTTNRVSIQISNLCNYVHLHRGLCAAGNAREVQILPTRVIKEVVSDLKEMGWGKESILAFHAYNEPLIDPRLLLLVQYVKKELPDVCPYLMTNGWYLNEHLMVDIIEAGFERITITSYSREERRRLSPIVHAFPEVRMHIGRLKPQMLNPGKGPSYYKRCHAPLCDLTIRSSGNVGLCCIDHAETVVYGNVYRESLISILQRELPGMEKLQNELRCRRRSLNVCKTCWRRRKAEKPDDDYRWVKTREKKGGIPPKSSS
jgi:2-deoxy-scyllo-inosamine dehydrogenase (SAM-dependent)